MIQLNRDVIEILKRNVVRYEYKKTTGSDLFIGSVVTDMGNGEVDIMGEDEAPLGVVVSNGSDVPQNSGTPFSENVWVSVMIPSVSLEPYIREARGEQRLNEAIPEVVLTFRTENAFKLYESFCNRYKDNRLYLRLFFFEFNRSERKELGTFEIFRFIIVRDVFTLFGKKINVPEDQQIIQYHSILESSLIGQSPFTDIPIPEIQIEDYKIHYLAISKDNNFKSEKYKASKHGYLYKEAILSLKKMRIKNTDFKITDLITLKLENRKTEIYINGNKFKQCKFLLLDLDRGKSYKRIESIDEASKVLSKKMEHDHSIIPPETEFWGHCSNIQAWVENDYDLRIIHSNLGVPLLKELIKEGDPKAKIAWKEEIMYRIQETGFKAFKTHEADIKKYFTKEDNENIKEIIREDLFKRIEENKLSPIHALKNYHSFLTEEDKETLYESILIFKNKLLDRIKSMNTQEFINFYQATEVYLKRPNIKETLTLEEINNARRIAGGDGEDDNVMDKGDYLMTITTALREFERVYGTKNTPLIIYSHPEVAIQAQIGNHFYDVMGITEKQRILERNDIETWVTHLNLPEYKLFFQDIEGNIIKTGDMMLS